MDIELGEIKLAGYTCTSTHVETEPLDLEKLKEAMIQVREEFLERERKRMYEAMCRFNYRPSFGNPYIHSIKVMS